MAAPFHSHHELPVVEHPPDRLEAVEFVPFREAIDAGVASMMTGHILVPALDEAFAAPGDMSSALRIGVAGGRKYAVAAGSVVCARIR